MFKIFGEVDAIVGGARLFAEGDDIAGSLGVEFEEPFAEAMPDHAVADDDDILGRFCNHCGRAPLGGRRESNGSERASSMPALVGVGPA